MASDDKEEVRRRFEEGDCHRGTLTFWAMGASVEHQRINIYVELTEEGNPPERFMCQLTPDQAQYALSTLSDGIDNLRGYLS
ncbi:MAG: hypothetical protein F4189_00390 [Acidimicrobiaceae bacterium]|nr:hypothetical protein [Acidimicrobiaceae bacterium]